MCSRSINIFSLYSQTAIFNPKFLNNGICKSLEQPLNDQPLKNLLPFQLSKLRTSSKPSQIFAECSCSHTPFTPLSKFSGPSCSISTHKLSKWFSEKVVFFLIGSFIFMGCFNKRAVIAQPAQTTSSTENLQHRSEEEELYEKLLEDDPLNVEALKVILHSKMRRGKSKEAVKYVERLIDVEPDEVEWRLLLALCYETMGQLSKAKRLFKEILEERPLMLRALHGLALVMHKNLEGPAVFDMLNKALELARREKRVPEERNIGILIAQMHVVKGDLEEGLKRFQDLVNENPRDFRPYLCQGIIYSLLDKKTEAEEQFETYRALAPEEFPQRGFLDDVVLTAKTASQEQFQKEFNAEFSYRK